MDVRRRAIASEEMVPGHSIHLVRWLAWAPLHGPSTPVVVVVAHALTIHATGTSNYPHASLLPYLPLTNPKAHPPLPPAQELRPAPPSFGRLGGRRACAQQVDRKQRCKARLSRVTTRPRTETARRRRRRPPPPDTKLGTHVGERACVSSRQTGPRDGERVVAVAATTRTKTKSKTNILTTPQPHPSNSLDTPFYEYLRITDQPNLLVLHLWACCSTSTP